MTYGNITSKQCNQFSLFPLQVYINWMNFIFNLVFPLTILLTLNIKIYRELRTLRYPYAINGLPMTVDAIEDSPVAAPFIRKPRAPKINSITYNSRPSCLTIDDAEERDRNTRYILCKPYIVRGNILRHTWNEKRTMNDQKFYVF